MHEFDYHVSGPWFKVLLKDINADEIMVKHDVTVRGH